MAELARLIGQTDPFGNMGRANAAVAPQPPRAAPRTPYQPSEEPDEAPPAPPPWMQRANRQELPKEAMREVAREPQWPPQREAQRPVLPAAPAEEDYPAPVHPLHRYAAQHVEPEQGYQDYQQEPSFAESPVEADPSRYDDALYGQIESGAQDYQREPAYPDDPYAYQDGYEEEEEQVVRRRGGLMTVAAVLALAVVGTGAAFTYRSYFGSPRSGEPPIIHADNSPTKIVPAPSDGSAKVPDRLAAGDGTEKIVPREEAPVDVNARTVPRVVFPPLNQNSNPPAPASVAPSAMPAANGGPTAAPSNGTLPNGEPRRVRTFSVRGDQPDGSAVPVSGAPPSTPAAAPKPAVAARPGVPRSSPSSANASANAPLSLSPQASEPAPAPPPRAQMAATNTPVQTAPVSGAASSGIGGSYLVQVSSQKSEGDAQASYRALQGKFPAVLGSHAPLIKRADLGEKGVVYRAMVGPFGSQEEALQFCGNLKSAGGQCFVPRN